MNVRYFAVVCAAALGFAASPACATALGFVGASEALVVAGPGSSAANPFVLNDTYIGPARPGSANTDAYGGRNYDTQSMAVYRSGGSINFEISTNFAGRANSGIGYGDLLFGPIGGASGFNGWTYALDIPKNPGSMSGSVNLVRIRSSNLAAGSYRTTVPVEIGNYSGVEVLATGVWSATFDDVLRFSINDGGVLGNDFTTQWAMTCGNDVIYGDIHLATLGASSSSGGGAPTPSPGGSSGGVASSGGSSGGGAVPVGPMAPLMALGFAVMALRRKRPACA